MERHTIPYMVYDLSVEVGARRSRQHDGRHLFKRREVALTLDGLNPRHQEVPEQEPQHQALNCQDDAGDQSQICERPL